MTESHENAGTTSRELTPHLSGGPVSEQDNGQSAAPDLSHHVHELPKSKRERHGLGGLLAGLRTTATSMTQHVHTRQYPDEKPDLPARSRGAIALLEENCTVCMLCARECPDWCLYIDSHKETVPAETEGGRDRQRNVLDRFAIDFSLCMYCGICIEACPFDALFWTPEFEYASGDIRDLLHEKDTLAEWMQTVPVPDDLDERAPVAAEVTAAHKPPRVQRRRVKE